VSVSGRGPGCEYANTLSSAAESGVEAFHESRMIMPFHFAWFLIKRLPSWLPCHIRRLTSVCFRALLDDLHVGDRLPGDQFATACFRSPARRLLRKLARKAVMLRRPLQPVRKGRQSAHARTLSTNAWIKSRSRLRLTTTTQP